MCEVTRVREVAAEERGGRAQAITCVQLLFVAAGARPALMIAQSTYHRVSRLRTRGRGQIVQLLEAKSDGQGQRRGQNKGGAGLIIQARTISPSAEGRRTGSAVDGRQCRRVILILIRIELEAQADASARQRELVILGLDAGKALDERVA